MGRQKQILGKDKRGEIKVDPKVELKDYSGPLKSDLRFTDFSREQLARMYSLAHHYDYEILRAHRDYIREIWGPEAVCEAQEDVWGNTMIKDIHQFITETMNIKGQDLEAFMKAWQIDMNSQPGDFFDVIIEMPSKDRGIVTFNRCPVVEEYEASGQTAELHDICMKTCPPAIKNTAALYNADIDLKVLAMPPRKGKDHICCKFEVCNKNGTAKKSKETEKIDLRIDKKKRDIRGEIKIDPKLKLEDYSGPFKTDLRITDFSREQLARMYFMAHKYYLTMNIAYQMWVYKTYGAEPMGGMAVEVWGKRLTGIARQVHMRFMNIKGDSIDSFMKAWQMDLTALPPNFDMVFEMPSKDRGIITFNRCFGVTMMEPIGMIKELLELCAMDPEAIGNSAKLYHPDMRTKILAFPPREGQDEICCKWELYYDVNAPKVTWFDNRE
jgi:hypothetical protein